MLKNDGNKISKGIKRFCHELCKPYRTDRHRKMLKYSINNQKLGKPLLISIEYLTIETHFDIPEEIRVETFPFWGQEKNAAAVRADNEIMRAAEDKKSRSLNRKSYDTWQQKLRQF